MKRSGCGHRKCRSLPPRKQAHAICSSVSTIKTIRPACHAFAMLLPAATSSASFHMAETSRAGHSTSQMPVAMLPSTAAFRTPMNPSRKRPVRAIVPLTCSKYPRLRKFSTGTTEHAATNTSSATQPKSQSKPDASFCMKLLLGTASTPAGTSGSGGGVMGSGGGADMRESL